MSVLWWLSEQYWRENSSGMGDEHRTSNVQHRILNGKAQEGVKSTFDLGAYRPFNLLSHAKAQRAQRRTLQLAVDRPVLVWQLFPYCVEYQSINCKVRACLCVSLSAVPAQAGARRQAKMAKEFHYG